MLHRDVGTYGAHMIKEPEKLEPIEVLPEHPHPGQHPIPGPNDPLIEPPPPPGYPDFERPVYRVAPEDGPTAPPPATADGHFGAGAGPVDQDDQVVGIGEFEQEQFDTPGPVVDFGYDQVVGIGEFEQEQFDNLEGTDIEIIQ